MNSGQKKVFTRVVALVLAVLLAGSALVSVVLTTMHYH